MNHYPHGREKRILLLARHRLLSFSSSLLTRRSS